jgi:hypothetical protein
LEPNVQDREVTMQSVFPLLSFGPVAIYLDLIQAENRIIDLGEHFVKQSYRNRFDIAGPNGRQTICVHIAGSKSNSQTQSEKRLFDDGWRRIMLRSLRTAYNSSAFYEHYGPELEDFIAKPTTTLLQFNKDSFELIADWLQIESPSFAQSYIEPSNEIIDFRKAYDQKTFNKSNKVYRQVFDARHGFMPNLSILDLIFNLGPSANEYLRQDA